MWLKYSDAPILVGEQWDRKQSAERGCYDKPCGFWITDDTEYCWRHFCTSDGFWLEGLTHKHEVALDESGILFLRSPGELDDFTRQYGVEDPRWSRSASIDWRKVAERHTGIIITPYQWSRRLDAPYRWYYTWDCASGCIWKASAIRDIRLIEIDHDVVKLGEREQRDVAAA